MTKIDPYIAEMLQAIANHEDPSRTKDIADIEHLIAVYFDLYTEEIYTEKYDVLEIYEPDARFTKLVAARLIGREMKRLLRDSVPTLLKLLEILAKRQTETWQAMADGLQD